MPTEIRPAGDDDFFGWLPLFDAYCRFYETDLDDAKAAAALAVLDRIGPSPFAYVDVRVPQSPVAGGFDEPNP